jgi:fido (protein-threonine AMPylation protein)
MLTRMYGAEPDPYCYPGTTVLINRLGTTDQSILNAFEAEMTSIGNERASAGSGGVASGFTKT